MFSLRPLLGVAVLAFLLPATPVRAASPLDGVGSLETRLLGQAEWLAGSRAAVRVTVRDADHDRPIEADVALSLIPPTGSAILLWQGRANTLGTVDLSLKVPSVPPGVYQLRAEVASSLGPDRVEHAMTIAWGAEAGLKTDREVYFAGETVRLRALALVLPALRPAARLPLPIEIYDPNGNRVLRRAVECSEWGNAAFDFPLAAEALSGLWRAVASFPRGSVTANFRVTQATRHELNLEIETDRDWAVPGETLTGQLRAVRRSGLPAAGVHAVVRARLAHGTGIVAWSEGTTDPDGVFRFALKLPTSLLADSEGVERLELSAAAEDRAHRHGSDSASVTLASQPMLIRVTLEGGAWVPRVANELRLAVAYPNGTPVSGARIEILTGGPQGRKLSHVADSLGVAEVTLAPAAAPGPIRIEAFDAQGRSALSEPRLSASDTGATAPPDLRLRVDRTSARVGESIAVTVQPLTLEAGSIGRAHGTLLLDILSRGQTVVTKALALGRDPVTTTLPLGPELSGLIELRAYRLGPSDRAAGTSRHLLVLPATDLRIEAVSDRTAYLPGDTARLAFSATDTRGTAAIASLAISAWQVARHHGPPRDPTLARLALELERGRFDGFAPGSLDSALISAAAASDDAAARERVLRFLLESLPPSSDRIPLFANSRLQRLDTSKQRWRQSIDDDALRIQRALKRYQQLGKSGSEPLSGPESLKTLSRLKLLLSREAMDPWGRQYRARVEYGWLRSLASAGPDGRFGTLDDVGWQGTPPDSIATGAARTTTGVVPPARAAAAPATVPPMSGETTPNASPGRTEATESTALRDPQLPPLMWIPELLTDDRGHAYVDVTLAAPGSASADLPAHTVVEIAASSRPGGFGFGRIELGLAPSVDLRFDPPSELVAGDELNLPLTLASLAPQPERLRIQVTTTGVLELTHGASDSQVQLLPRTPVEIPVRVRALAVGTAGITVTITTPGGPQSVHRSVLVRPAAFNAESIVSGMLDQPLSLSYPRSEGESWTALRLRLHAGPLAFARSALAALRDRPLPGTAAAAAELRLATLLAHQGGGPASLSLQRMLASDLEKSSIIADSESREAQNQRLSLALLALGPLVLGEDLGAEAASRTRAALTALARADGAYGGTADTDVDLRSTALAGWAHRESAASANTTGANSPATRRWLSVNLKQILASDDPWTVAAALRAITVTPGTARSPAPVSPEVTALSRRLVALRSSDPDAVAPWALDGLSPSGAAGAAAALETTALSVSALAAAGTENDAARAGLSWLLSHLAPDGSLGAPWATALTCEAAIMLLPSRAPGGMPSVLADGVDRTPRETFTGLWDSRDILIDTPNPANSIPRLEVTAGGGALVQVVRQRTTGGKPSGDSPLPAIALEVAWKDSSRTMTEPFELRIEAAARVARPLTDVMIDVGLPAGFAADETELEQLLVAGEISAFRVLAPRLWLRIARIEPGTPFAARIHASPGFAFSGRAADGFAWEQANPGDRARASTDRVRVKDNRKGR